MSPNKILDGKTRKISKTTETQREHSRGERGREDTRGKEKTMRSRQSDRISTMQVRIDSSMHQLVKVKAAESQMTIKSLVEIALGELLAVGGKK